MIDGARYAHTNLVARDWRALARFYREVFGCVPVPPERHYAGAALEAGTAIPGARLDGVHLRLPGGGADGPTLEIFTYATTTDRPADARGPGVDRAGLRHLAFAVPDVAAARRAVLAAGGRPVGEVVTLETERGDVVEWCYVTDPEGNVLELQSWS